VQGVDGGERAVEIDAKRYGYVTHNDKT